MTETVDTVGTADIVSQQFAAFEEARRQHAAGFFRAGAGPIHVARAPGRLDVMGGIADYSGSLVAEMPIAQAALVGAQADPDLDGVVIVRSANATASGFTPEVMLPSELFINPVSMLRRVRENPKSERWVGYAAGCVSLLRAESLIGRGTGARIFVHSDVPLGAGVSSSAAIEVATMRALCSAFGVQMDGLALARLCQRVENDVMEAPCGIMDQVTSVLGDGGTLLKILCQPHTVQGSLALPEGWSVFGIDSGVKHSIAGAGYIQVRVAAFMGYRLLADRAGSGFGGYLCNVTPDAYTASFPERLPESIGGAEFLARWGGIYDSVTTIDPAVVYPLRAATEHAIYEMDRVRRFVDALTIGDDASVHAAGQLMYGSHASYSACGLGTDATDLLVELARARPDVAGAKITGGGSGGTVCVLCHSDAETEIADTLASAYRDRMGIDPRIIRGTSPGALATPVWAVAA